MRKGLMQGLLAVLFLAVFALPSFAQSYTGRIDVTVVDGTGAVLPGVSVDLSGPQIASTVTASNGEAHFLNLAPGTYTVTAKLQKFMDYKNDNVVVTTGLSVPLKATLSLSGVAASTEVTSAAPVIDPRKETVSTTMTLDDLQKIPSSRDPWVVLQQVPGIVVDRVNVGGAESGQQSQYMANGAAADQNTWSMDGISITDMAALGSSPTYYDFDMFQEMNVSTGGSDLSLATPGVALNFVLRSGTNQWRGSGRYYFENHDMQANNVSGSAAGQIASYNRINSLLDYGAEGGGPLIKDRLFLQASAGETHPKLNIYSQCSGIAPANFAASGCASATSSTTYGISSTDETILQNYSVKATGEINKNIRASFTYFDGNKVKNGRGASATRPTETTEDQTGPTNMYKGEMNFTLSNSAFVAVRYAHLTGGFSLTPKGVPTQEAYLDDNGVWHGNYYMYSTNRPQDTISADGNWFKGKNELKFGFGWRKASVTSETSWPGGGIITVYTGYPTMNAEIVRDHHTNASAIYGDGYFGDTVTFANATLNGGVRWDRQQASLGVVADPANAADPQGLLPALTGQAATNAIIWNSLSPRAGLAVSLDKQHKTLLRMSYSTFASQINATQASVLGTVQYSYTYYVNVQDTNHNGVADPSEIAAAYAANHANFAEAVGFNVNNPAALTTPNKIGTYKTPKTTEAVIGLDHELTRDFAVSASYTFRRYNDFDWNHLTGVSGAVYSVAGSFTCNAAQNAVVGGCVVSYYDISAAAAAAATGTTYESRPGYNRKFDGVDLTATKRMSHNWMARAVFSTDGSREYFPTASSQYDPTPTIPLASTTTSAILASPNMNGGQYVEQSGGSGKSNIFLVLPKYQVILTSAVQTKYAINLGVNYLLRQGYAEPYYVSNVSTGDALFPVRSILVVTSVDEFRLPAVQSLDMRVGKTIKANKTTFDLDFDIFNVLNAATPLQRQLNLHLATANQILEIENPRIFRVGVRIGF